MTNPRKDRTEATSMVPLAAAAALTLAVLMLSACAPENDRIVASGTIEARTVRVPARISGELVELSVEEGEEVEAGTTVARLDDQELILARHKAGAAVDLAESQLALLLEGAAPQDVRQAEETVSQIREETDLARREFERTERLFRAGSISRSEYDRAQSRLNQTRARLNAAQAALDKARGPARPAELDAARARLEEARAAYDLAVAQVEKAKITAPLSGTVLTTPWEAGEFLPAGSAVVEIADLAQVYVNVYVSEPRLAALRVGGTATVIPDGAATSMEGRVAFISPQAEFTPTNVQTEEQRAKLVYRVKVRVDNPDGVLKIGMPVEVDITGDGEDDAD